MQGTYLFFYSYTNNGNIYDIHEKFIVRESINDFASFSPLPNTILKTMDYSIYFKPKNPLSVNIFITNYRTTFNEDNNFNIIVNLSKVNGDYYYYLTNLISLNKGDYTFIIQENTCNNILYTQTVHLSDLKFKKVYYIDNHFITIENTQQNITNLSIKDENNLKYNLKFNQIQFQFLFQMKL